MAIYLGTRTECATGAAYTALRKTSNIDGTIIGYPALEAIYDAFGIIKDCMEQFEVSQRPTIPVALHTLYQVVKKSENTSNDREVWRGNSKKMVQPSVYSRKLSELVKNHLKILLHHHPLLLFGCYMNPVFRESEFIEDVTLRAEYRSRAEEFARKLSRKYQMKNQLPHRFESPINIDSNEELEPPSNGFSTVSRGRNRMVPSPNQVSGKKRSFDLMECSDSAQIDLRSLDEVCMYNLVQIGTIPGTR